MAETFNLQANEAQTSIRVETLVASEQIDSRIFTIDGITKPDFSTLYIPPREMHRVCAEFVLHRTEDGLKLVPDDEPPEGETRFFFEGEDTVHAWAAEAIDALRLDIPEKGVHLGFRYGFIAGLVPSYNTESSSWHFDLGEGALTLFKKSPTEVLDEVFQDTYPPESQGAYEFVDEQTLAALAGIVGPKPLEGHIKRPQDGQTMYIGRRALHRKPGLKVNQDRPGIICFINEVDKTQPAR